MACRLKKKKNIVVKRREGGSPVAAAGWNTGSGELLHPNPGLNITGQNAEDGSVD
jgi:hypothetical protein